MGLHRIPADYGIARDPSLREVVDNVVATMAATDAAKAREEAEAKRQPVRPVDTPAVSPWTSAPETFAEAEGPRVNAATLGPLYRQTGVRQSGRPQDMADWQTQAVASLPHDPMARLAVFARARFPELPVEHAMQRYGFHGDRAYYIDRDGTPKWEEPSIATAIHDPVRYAASWTGPALPAAGAIGGGLAGGLGGIALGGPGGGFYGGFYGAGAGSAAGEWARQELAKRFAGEQLTDAERVFNAAIAGAMGAGGYGVGQVVVRDAARRYGPAVPALASGLGQLLGRGAVSGAYHVGSRAGLGPTLNDSDWTGGVRIFP